MGIFHCSAKSANVIPASLIGTNHPPAPSTIIFPAVFGKFNMAGFIETPSILDATCGESASEKRWASGMISTVLFNHSCIFLLSLF